MRGRSEFVLLSICIGVALALLWFLCLAPPAEGQVQVDAAIIRVATTGTDTSGCGGEINPCRTVQYAVDQALDGDEIRVAGGTYIGVHTRNGVTQMVYISQTISIRGGYTTTNWNVSDPDANPTTLDAQGQGRVVYVETTPYVTLTLDGLRIVNGHGSSGGGVWWEYTRGYLAIRNCDILSNTGNGGGGGVYVYGGLSYDPRNATVLLENNRIISNSAAVDVTGSGGGVFARSVNVTMTGNLLQGNAAADLGGGGAELYDTRAYVADNTFQGNATSGNGGGMESLWGDVFLTRNSFLDNTAGDPDLASSASGGGLAAEIDTGHTYTVTHNLFQGNLASQGGIGTGGGVMISGDHFVFSHNRVVGNAAVGCSVAGSRGQGGGAYFNSGLAKQSLVWDNLFQDNWAAASGVSECTGRGGGLFVRDQSRLWLDGNRILNNHISYYPDFGNRYYVVLGGGIYVGAWGVTTMTNNIIAGNRYYERTRPGFPESPFSDGGGIYLAGDRAFPDPTLLILYHNTIADNQLPAVVNKAAVITMSHTIFAGHDVDLKMEEDSVYAGPPPTTTAEYTLWWPGMTTDIESGSWNHSHDFTADPDFVSTADDDYHLGSGSAAIDQGTGVSVTTDIDGHPRPIGAGYDLGADEYTGVDLSPSHKSVSPQRAEAGEVVTFTIVLRNGGTAAAPHTTMLDMVPISTTYVPGSARATSGLLSDTGTISWTGTVTPQVDVAVTFQVTVEWDGLIVNTAVVTDTYGGATTLTAWVNGRRVYLPLVVRSYAP